MIYSCDIEADGLLDDVTKVHCLSYNELDKDPVTIIGTIQQFFEALSEDDTLVWHNNFGYDYPVLEKLGYTIPEHVQSIDTLALSREWWPDNPRGHGLEAWAKFLGTHKPEISDWENLPIEEYIRRCEEDTKTTEKVFLFLTERLGIEI